MVVFGPLLLVGGNRIPHFLHVSGMAWEKSAKSVGVGFTPYLVRVV
jgi:hypothetical protein